MGNFFSELFSFLANLLFEKEKIIIIIIIIIKYHRVFYVLKLNPAFVCLGWRNIFSGEKMMKKFVLFLAKELKCGRRLELKLWLSPT
jgi:hypothetical protein